MRSTTLLSTALLVSFGSAQILTTGNTSPPSCALTCPVLNQAVAACSGQTTSNQATWICFCQSGYLKEFTTPVAGQTVTICNDVCGASDITALQNWYTGNCGTDLGASEHAGAATTATAAGTTAGTTTTAAATSTVTAGSSSNTGDPASSDGSSTYTGTWWSSHYKWIIMLIAILIGLALLSVLLVWLKRRHDRKQDAITGGFNEGITMRSTPMASAATAPPVAMQPSSGRDSPVRTRDAFMPYGYGYARSESRLGSRTNLGDAHNSYTKGSPLAHDGTTATDLEKSDSFATGKKRVYVSERSMREAGDLEKSYS